MLYFAYRAWCVLCKADNIGLSSSAKKMILPLLYLILYIVYELCFLIISTFIKVDVGLGVVDCCVYTYVV